MGGKKGNETPEQVLDPWLERDLEAAAEADVLLPAFERDEIVHLVNEAIASGRAPVLTGAPGVGKTAIVHHLVRLARGDDGPEHLRGRRMLQLSIRQRASRFPNPRTVVQHVGDLLEVLMAMADDVAIFFSDLHLGHALNLEPFFETLAFRFPGPILAEAEGRTLESMLEDAPELERYFVPIHVDEPSLESSRRMLTGWTGEMERRHGTRFEPAAIDHAVQLTHRFLARGHFPRKAVDLLGRALSLSSDDLVTGSDVLERFCRQHRVPRALVDPSVALDLDDLDARFRSRVLGQDDAVDAVVSVLGLVKAGLADPRRPFGVFLFVGPTGVGKTHVAQLLAEYLFGSSERLVRINLTDFALPGSDAALFGEPDAYPPARQRGMLTQRLWAHPFAVLLLDEFEKAHEAVHDRFLQLIDEGCFINGAGETISCRSMIIIATSNVGAELHRGQGLGFREHLDLEARRHELARRLERAFRFELLNRFDRVVQFLPLARHHIRAIAARELDQLAERPGLRQQDLSLDVDESVLDWLVAHGHDPDNGARFLRRTVERHVTSALADTIVRQRPKPGARLLLRVRAGRVAARCGAEPAHDPELEPVALPEGTTERPQALDAEGLARVARELLDAAAPRLEALERARAEHAELLARMAGDGFWNRDDRHDVLERFREVDVAVSMQERLAEPLTQLSKRVASPLDGAERRGRLARQLERAAASLREWERRLEDEGPAQTWVVVSNASPLRPAGQWIADVARMEIAWCRRLHLQARIVAQEIAEGELARVVLHVEGPGAATTLAMENGIHRSIVRTGRTAKARVDALACGAAPPDAQRVRPSKRREGALGQPLSARGRLELDRRGLSIELEGDDDDLLAWILADLESAWAEPLAEQPPVARVYGDGGDVVRDPRTGRSVPRVKDVLDGGLDAFLQAWRAGRAAEEGPK